MTAILFLIAAVGIMYADKIKAYLEAHKDKVSKLTAKHAAAASCVVLALVMFYRGQSVSTIDDGRPAPSPPAPGSVGPLDLRGLFTGPTAADDAAALSALCSELACYVEDDGKAEKPRLATGWAIADLRTAARDIRMKGQTFGSRQPAVRDAVGRYLERPEILGTKGGPIGPKDRSKWVQAFRDIATAAEAAIK